GIRDGHVTGVQTCALPICYTVFRWLFQATFLLVPSIVIVSVVYELGMLTSPASATFAATVVGFSFAAVYYGVASTVVTDPLAVRSEERRVGKGCSCRRGAF